MSLDLLDPTSDWAVKLARADEHIDALRAVLAEYRRSNPYTVRPEGTDDPDKTAFRLRINQPPPRRASTIVGDALHNLRSALDAAAFALISGAQPRPLTKQEERLTNFPVTNNPQSFQGWCEKDARTPLLTTGVIDQLRVGQPWYWRIERSDILGTEPTTEDLAGQFRWSYLARLNRLNNIDKHRRVALMAWWPTLVWWGSNEDSPQFKVGPGDGTFTDDSIAWYVYGPKDQLPDFQHEFVMALTEDPAHLADGADPDDAADFLARARTEVWKTLNLMHAQGQAAATQPSA